MVVVGEPDWKGLQALLVRLVELSVGPFAQGGLDEGLRLPIRLWMARWRELVGGADASHCASKEPGVGVGVSPVGHHALDVNAQVAEVERSSQQEAGGLGSVIGSSNLGEGQPGAVVDGDVEVLPAPATADAGIGAKQGMPAPGRNPAQLLNVEVKQLAWPLPDIADTHPGGAVSVGQPGFAGTPQDRVHGGPSKANRRSDSMRSPAPLAARLQDFGYLGCRRFPRRAAGRRGAGLGNRP